MCLRHIKKESKKWNGPMGHQLNVIVGGISLNYQKYLGRLFFSLNYFNYHGHGLDSIY
jgi:hypothetical protein